MKICPENRQGKLCIEIDIIAKISDDICSGCSLCEKKCPFNAINIVNLPSELDKEIVHCYGGNAFRIYKMPILKKGKIIGLLGENGIGKSTIVNIFANKIKPNFNTTDIDDDFIISKFRGVENHKYFTKLYSGELKVVTKPQNIESLRKNKNTVKFYFDKKEDTRWKNELIRELYLEKIMTYSLNMLSGGQLQCVVIALILLQDADVYIIDEPCNYLDVKQRLIISKLIRRLSNHDNYILVIDHDVAILDYLTDNIHVLYGVAGAYGVSSLPYPTNEAINMFFSGYLRQEKMLFRTDEFNMNFNIDIQYESRNNGTLNYKGKTIVYPRFTLEIEEGEIPTNGSLILALGRNGTGKTTYLNYISREVKLNISIKPQHLDDKPNIKVGEYLPIILNSLSSLGIEKLLDRQMNELSGGELQMVMIYKCLSTSADIYLMDEPSANLDINHRILVTKVVKKFILNNEKIGIIIEHDITMALLLTKDCPSKVILFDENVEKGLRSSVARSPTNLHRGINNFMKEMNITMRKDYKSQRNRINKIDSRNDREQKTSGKYYM